MYTRWTQHLDTDEEKEKFKREIINSRFVLDRIKQMIEEDEKSLDRSEMDQRIYDIPNWEYRQAHKNGVRQYMATIKTLLNLDQQKGN